MISVIGPEQIVCDAGLVVTTGTGSTVIVAVIGVPVQLPIEGILVNVTVTCAVVVLVTSPAIVPVPLAGMPVTSVSISRVQV